MKKTLFFLLVFTGSLIISVSLEAQIHLAPGMRMPSFEADWVRKPAEFSKAPPKQGEKPLKKITVLTIADALSGDFIRTVRMLESLDSILRHEKDAKFRTAVVVRNDAQQLQTVLKSEPVPVLLAIGSDKNGRTGKQFGTAVTAVPYSFVAVDGQLIWSGHPMELSNIILSAVKGNFSLSKQQQIESCRKQMQNALRAGLPAVASGTAERILELAPTDSLALQAKLYACNAVGDSSGAAAFLRKHIRKHPEGSMQLRMLLLDTLLRSGNIDEWKKEVAPATEDALKKGTHSLNLAAYFLDFSPKNILPLKEIFQLKNKAVSTFSKIPEMQDLYADSLEISARANYAACRLEQAISEQQMALDVRKISLDPREKRTADTLNFYKTIRNFKF